ncbi:MAG: SGNH/GDSL hydrolase family protein [Nanoarchaeota archaeon]
MNPNPRAIRILCYGDSNTWGWVPSKMGRERYDTQNRWPGILQKKLGEKYEVIEEGLGGRTTMFDDPRPEFPCRNGLQTFASILESHLPIDLVIFMLGTTDAKEMMGLDSSKITEGMRRLIRAAKKFKTLDGFSSPNLLIIVPPILEEKTVFASTLFKGGTAKTKALIRSYSTLAKEEKVLYLNPTDEVKVDSEEGVHIDAENHKKLAELVYNKIILSSHIS